MAFKKKMKDYQHLSMAISLIWKLFLKILHVIIKTSERVIVCVRFLEILGKFFKKKCVSACSSW